MRVRFSGFKFHAYPKTITLVTLTLSRYWIIYTLVLSVILTPLVPGVDSLFDTVRNYITDLLGLTSRGKFVLNDKTD